MHNIRNHIKQIYTITEIFYKLSYTLRWRKSNVSQSSKMINKLDFMFPIEKYMYNPISCSFLFSSSNITSLNKDEIKTPI